MSERKSCIRCDSYLHCKDARKSIIFHCDRFKVTNQSLRQEKAILEEALELPLESPFGTSTSRNAISTVGMGSVVDDSNMFNAYEILQSMLNDKRIVSPDIKIPEGDFPEAPNFYTWCVDDEYLDQKPFVMQALLGTKLFAEYCPDCSDMEWMEHGVKVNDSLSKFANKIALLEHGKCPHCKKTKLQFFKKGSLNPYWELSLNAGQRSGKSALFGMMASYLTHRMIKLEKPNEVFGLLKANVLQGTFVALTFAQAKDTLWEPFYGHLLESPWFRSYHEMLEHVQQRTAGEDALFKLKDTFVQYKHRRIMVYPAGPDKRVLRGRTRFLAGIDELGWFNNGIGAAGQVKMNANEVYIALERSLLTVRSKSTTVVRSGFYNVPFSYFINISSPSSVRDKIMELVRKSQGSRRMLGLSAPTWKMNPHVPKSALAEEFRKDPIAAMRDYGAQPPLTNSPFISSGDKIEPCFAKKQHFIKLRYQHVRSKDKSSSELYAELDEVKASGKPSVLAIDAGHTNNAFAFAVGHRAPNGYPVLSVVGEVMPTPGTRLNYSLIYTHLLSELISLRNVVLCAADQWQSIKVLSDMEQDFAIHTRRYSLKYADMQLFKSYIDDGQILLPRPVKTVKEILKYDHSQYPQCFKTTPADHLVLQMLTVQDTGSSVLKGDGLNDDILRAGMLCFRMLTDEANDEVLNGPEEDVQQRYDLTTMMVSRNYSGGGSGGGSSGGAGGQQGGFGIMRQRQG